MQNTEVIKIIDRGDQYTKGTMMMKKKKIILGAFFLLFTGLFCFSCKDKGTNPIPVEDTSFRFKVIVKNTAGNPVNGLRVSAWNILSVNGSLYKTSTQKLSKKSNISSSVTLGFSAPVAAKITFSIFNLKDQEIATLINGQRESGQYTVQWNIPWTVPPAIPSGVYKCKLVATKTSSDTVIFRDSIYAVLHNYDPDINIIGWTSQGGLFETTDALLFPRVLDLPPLVHTNMDPDSLGTFSYTDSVAIVLTDTVAHTQQRINVAIGKQVNAYNLTWNPQNSQLARVKQESTPLTKLQSIASDTLIIEVPPLAWKLYQNYPNPFN
jgi:hypothetical protein